MCGSTNLDTPGWVGSLWMGQRHWLPSVPEEQLQPFVLKNHSQVNNNSGSIFLHLTSLLSTQFTHLLVGDLCSLLGFNSLFSFLASFRLSPLKKSENILERNWSQSDGISKPHGLHVLLFSPVIPMFVTISKVKQGSDCYTLWGEENGHIILIL